jgi:8-oxo-dGTP pyrophosphatase MutT (NUDIX family)
MNSTTTTDFKVDPSLSKYQISVKEYLEADGQCHQDVAGSALVFSGERILLIQRSEHDSYPSRFEIPGGGCDAEDLTILHGVAREVHEETGLRVSAITKEIGQGYTFVNSRGLKVIKFSFSVEVREAEECKGYEGMPVQLDPNEHQSWRWATVDEIMAGKSRDVDLIISTPQQKETILQGLRWRTGLDTPGGF